MTHHVVIEFVNFLVMHMLKCNLGSQWFSGSVVSALVFISTGPGFVPAGVILIRSCVHCFTVHCHSASPHPLRCKKQLPAI